MPPPEKILHGHGYAGSEAVDNDQHLVLVIYEVLRKAHEWGDKLLCCNIFEGDIEAAFDNADSEYVGTALLGLGVPATIVAAVLHEQIGMRVEPSFEDLEIESCAMSGSISQGGVHSTFCWNALIGWLISRLLPIGNCDRKLVQVDPT